ncbi:MAG: hypothetical protein WCH98_14845, partial [Verrucomicrobiota bacterium]
RGPWGRGAGHGILIARRIGFHGRRGMNDRGSYEKICIPRQIVSMDWNFLNMFCVIIPVFRVTFLPGILGVGGFLNGGEEFF